MEMQDKSFNFGTVYEANGKVSFKIVFFNSGDQKLSLSRIISPGITALNFPKEDILPGQKSEIMLEFNPFSLVGPVHKTVTIFSNAKNSPQQFVLTGKILSGSLSNLYRYNVGGAAFKQSQFNFGYIFKGDIITRYFPVMNNSNKAIGLRFSQIPDYVSIEPNFKELGPNEQGLLEVTYNTELCKNWDFIIDKVSVEVVGEETTKGIISLTSNLRENFDSIASIDRRFHPIAEIPIKVFNFDTISSTDIVNYNYLLVNRGAKQLNIRALKPTCGCTAALADTNVIAPGDSTYINVRFDAEGYSGMTKQGVAVISDDPLEYKQFLWIAGVVK